MKARGIVIGCSVTALVIIVVSLIAIVVTWRRMTARIPVQQPVALVDAQTRGFAAMRLSPGDPLVGEILSRNPDLKDVDPNDFLPASILWLAHGEGTAAGHSLVMSVEPRGRMMGFIADVSLWKAGRGGGDHVSRVEHGGEGITSFPGTGIEGHVFVRGNTFVWSSGLDAARRTVDLMNGALAAGETIARYAPDPAPRTLSGAIAQRDGALAGALTFLPGEALDVTAQDTEGIEALSFGIDAQPGDAAAGEIHLHFRDDVPAERRAAVTADLAARIARVAVGGMALQTAPRQEPERGVIDLTATGVSSTGAELKAWLNEAFRWLQRLEAEGV